MRISDWSSDVCSSDLAGVLEIHPWGSTLAAMEQPDMIIMDLDPGPGVEWQQVIEAAQEVRERLEKLGLAAFLKTSGGKGLHVVSPLKPDAGWDVVKPFTKRIADAMAADSPDRFVATVTKSKRKRSEEHTSELQSLMRHSYAVFCLKKKKN